MDGITRWRKSSRSNGHGGMCVEVGGVLGIVGVRDTKDRDGGTLAFSQPSWTAFLGAIKEQRFCMTWKKSSYSGQTGSCVEVGGGSGIVEVRDTKDRAGDKLAFSQQSWAAFLGAVKDQRFDLH